MEIKCRCCLACKTGVYHSLLSVFPDFGRNGSSILDVLRTVTSSQVTLSNDLPKGICQDCLKNLKTSFEFIVVFKNSQIFLERHFGLNHKENIENIDEVNADSIQTIIIEEGEIDDTMDDSTLAEQILIVHEDDDSESNNLEDIFDDGSCSIPNNETEENIKLNLNQLKYDKQAEDESEQMEETKNNVKIMEVYAQESLKKESMEIKNEDLSDQECQSSNFHCKLNKELIEMEKNREKNMNNITIMTIEDVLKVEKRKSSEKKIVLSVDDVVNIEKKTQKRRDQVPGVFMCDICNRIFNTRRNMALHKYRNHNPNWREKFKCTVCNMECRTLSMLKHHSLKHDEKRYKCHLCTKEYSLKQQLAVHIKGKHENLFESKYLCPLCGKSFKSSSALTYHLRIHDNQRNYMCRFCGFKSLALSALKRHERVHTGERPYTCRYCAKTFAGSAERRKHENVHDGILPYKCRYCDKGFVQTYNMKIHMLQHGGASFCDRCDKGFMDEDILRFHYHHKHRVVLEAEDDMQIVGNSE